MKYIIFLILFISFITACPEEGTICNGSPDVHNELYLPKPDDDKNSTETGYYESGCCPEGYECTKIKQGNYCCELKNVCDGTCCFNGRECINDICLLPF